MTDNRSPLSVIKFKPGTLHSDVAECVKYPGIFGTIINPFELLDKLIIKEGVNANSVRFVGQFSLNQEEIDKRMKEGLTIGLSERLELYWKSPTDLPLLEDSRRGCL